MDISRFGAGYRRTEPLPNCKNLVGTPFYSDRMAHAVELAFGRDAELWEHSAPHPILFVVIGGEGYVLVGKEESRVAAGEAVLWPANVPHRAWTTESPMTAIAFEYGIEVSSPTEA
ncbi:MAG: cupin domain-containing protein [Rudaea sp.]